MSDPKKLTIRHAQTHQPWTVPYSSGFQTTSVVSGMSHIHASHTVLHATKSIGKLATIFEALDHRVASGITADELETVRAMSADLLTVALRLANLYKFDLATALTERVEQKNGGPIKAW